MDRKDFIKGACVLCTYGLLEAVLESCSKSTPAAQPSAGNVNFTVDLSSSANAALKTVGGSVSVNNVVVVVRTSSGYVAVSNICTHQGCTVNYSNNGFYCPCHGGQFDINGNVQSGPPTSGLRKYNTSVSGNTLTVS